MIWLKIFLLQLKRSFGCNNQKFVLQSLWVLGKKRRHAWVWRVEQQSTCKRLYYQSQWVSWENGSRWYIVETFQRSEQPYNVRCANYVGDGKTFKEILDSNPYGNFVVKKKRMHRACAEANGRTFTQTEERKSGYWRQRKVNGQAHRWIDNLLQ